MREYCRTVVSEVSSHWGLLAFAPVPSGIGSSLRWFRKDAVLMHSLDMRACDNVGKGARPCLMRFGSCQVFCMAGRFDKIQFRSTV